MRAGVTGGAGYIGSHVVADLLDEGHEVFVIDNMVSGSQVNLFTDHPHYHFQKGDILNASDLGIFFQNRLDCIFHFSAYKAAGESMLIPSKYSANNIRGSFHLLEAMIQYSCPAIVFSSTAAVYGEPVYNPIDENIQPAP